MDTSDSILLERWQRRRDADAFTELVQRHSGTVFSCCTRMLGDRVLAEDVSQECFIALMQSGDSVRASLGAWLHTIAVRRSIDRIKGDARRRKREAAFVVTQDAGVAPDPAVDEILAVVDEAIAALPDTYRAAVVGRFLENQTHTDLARELGVAESTVRYRVDKGVDRVRQTLRREGIAVSAVGLAAALSKAVEAAPAELITRLGKLAMSGSVAVPGAAAVSVGWVLKVVFAMIAALAVGGIVWFGIANGKQDKPTPQRTVAQIPQEESDAATSAGETHETESTPRAVRSTEALVPAIAPAQEPEPFSIRGRIYDAKTGEGIAGVRANVYPAGGGVYVGRSEPTGEDGRYSISPIDDGMYSVNLGEIEGYPDPRGSRSVSVKLANGEPVSDIDFALERGIPVSGMVIGADGQPVAGAEVAAAIPSTPNAMRTQSGEQGSFTLYMPEASDSLRVQAQTERAESGVEGTFPLIEEGLEGVLLMLDRPKTASMSGIVIDGAGNPMTGAQLHLVRKDGSVLRSGNSGETGKDGRFRIAGIASAEFSVIVTPKGVNGYSTAEEYLRIHPEPGEALEGIEIVYGEKGGMAIAGRVVDSDGQPIERARVACYMEGGMEAAYTGTDGAFTLTGFEDKTYSLTVEHDNYSRGGGQFRAGTTDAEIVLKRRGRLAGRVVRADTGEPLAAYTLAFLMGEARAFDEMLYGSGQPIESDDGTFSMGEIQAGRFTVAAWAPGFAPEWRYVDVEEDEASNMEFRLTAMPPFEGTVVNQAGEPIANAAVYFVTGVSLDRMDRAAAAHSDGQGRFVVESLPADAKRLCAHRPGYGIGVIAIPGEKQIVLPEPAVVVGTIQIDGVAISDLFMNVYYPEAKYLPGTHQRPEPDGSFRFTGMSEGLLSINVVPNLGNPRSVTKTIDVKPGQEFRVDIVFERGTAVVEGTLSVEGVPLDTAYLALKRQLGETTETIRATLGMDGSYRFEEVWAGNLVLSITRVDPDDPYDPIVHEVDLNVADGQVLRQDIELPPLR